MPGPRRLGRGNSIVHDATPIDPIPVATIAADSPSRRTLDPVLWILPSRPPSPADGGAGGEDGALTSTAGVGSMVGAGSKMMMGKIAGS